MNENFDTLQRYIINHNNKKFKKLCAKITPPDTETISKLLKVALNHFNIHAIKMIQDWFDYSVCVVNFALTKIYTNVKFVTTLAKVIPYFREMMIKTSFYNNDLFEQVIVFFTRYKYENTKISIKNKVEYLFSSLNIRTIDKFVLIYNLLYSNNHDIFRDHFMRLYNDDTYVIFAKFEFIKRFPDKTWTDNDGNNILHYAAFLNHKKICNCFVLNI